MRPRDLAEVAQLTAKGDSFDRCFANFLDGFYAEPCESALMSTPEPLAPKLGYLGQVQDAYLAAAAEQLACAYHFAVPAWTASNDRKLHKPWFASSMAALRAVLLLESPAPFRARNLFVSENALARA